MAPLTFAAAPAFVIPELDVAAHYDLALRCRLSGEKLRAVFAVTSTEALIRIDAPGQLNGRSNQSVVSLAPLRRWLADLVLLNMVEITVAHHSWPSTARRGYGLHGGARCKVLLTNQTPTSITVYNP